MKSWDKVNLRNKNGSYPVLPTPLPSPRQSFSAVQSVEVYSTTKALCKDGAISPTPYTSCWNCYIGRSQKKDKTATPSAYNSRSVVMLTMETATRKLLTYSKSKRKKEKKKLGAELHAHAHTAVMVSARHRSC